MRFIIILSIAILLCSCNAKTYNNTLPEKFNFKDTEVIKEKHFHSSKAAISELKKVLKDSIPLISNDNDKQKLQETLDSITTLSKHLYEKDKKERKCKYQNDGATLEVGYSGGYYKEAPGNYVKARFYYKNQDSLINMYLTDDEYQINIIIPGAGARENVQGFGSPDSDYQFDYEPNRYYEINTKTSLVKVIDFYWD